MKSLRHSRPARAGSAPPRSREPARAVSAARCSSVAERGDCPAMPSTCESLKAANQPNNRWSTRQSLLSAIREGLDPDIVRFARDQAAAWQLLSASQARSARDALIPPEIEQ